jgi:NAD(P)H dehydrogenase (quinone)
LCGDSAFTLAELAAEVSKQSGKTLRYQDLSPADYAVLLQKAGLPEAVAQAVASWDCGAAQNALYSNSTQLAELIGRKTTGIATSIQAVLQQVA